MTLDHVGTVPVVGNLMHFSETPSGTQGPPPTLGGDNETLLTELGFDETQRAQIEQENARHSRRTVGRVLRLTSDQVAGFAGGKTVRGRYSKRDRLRRE